MVSAAEELAPKGALSPTFKDRVRSLLLRHEALRGYLLFSPTLLVMLGLLIVPLGGLAALSFWTQVGFKLDTGFTLANYWKIVEPGEGARYLGLPLPFAHPIYVALLLKSILMSLAATAVIILLAYPMAYFLAFRVGRHKIMWLILITVPFWTSYLLRVFAWKVILGYDGVINSGLKWLGLIEEPLEFLLYNTGSVIIALTHSWLAFAVLPIYVSLEKIDRSLLEAATDLGDNAMERFLRVTLPLSMPGVVAASLLVFIPTVGDYITQKLIGGPSGIMIGEVIANLFGKINDWPLGAAVSMLMMLAVTLLVCAFLLAVGYREMKEREA
jgi:spermidine/putrescine transport system permease protein